MAKIFLISINIIIVFALKIFFGGEVKVEQTMQDTINPGETLDVTLEITKGDREGFAKWQQMLPEGFIASSVEMNGATFSFKNQEMKVIWMELPKTETFTIKYKIETSPSVSGEHNLSGKFSFIEENERKDISSETFILTITDGAMAQNANSNGNQASEVTTDQESSDAENQETGEEDKPDSENAQIATPQVTNILNKNLKSTVTTTAAENDLIKITREVKHIEAGNYEVTLKVSKTDLSSFGKIEDYLPPNYTASALENMNGMFSFKGNVMKVLWMTLPQENEFQIKYALQSTSDDMDSAVVHGVFSYLNGDKSVQNKLAPTKFRNFLSPELIAEVEDNGSSVDDDETDTSKEVEEKETDQVATIEKEEVIEPSNTEKASDSEEQLVESITNIPAPETAVAYKVQIAASHKEVGQDYFTKIHSITEPVAIEFHETWYKYTIGSFPVYKQARDKRNKVWASDNKINDAFVTAYNSGDRISVQEALMISKQKWFK